MPLEQPMACVFVLCMMRPYGIRFSLPNKTKTHQVKNPMTALRTFGKLLLKRLPQDDTLNRELAKDIILQVSSSRMSRKFRKLYLYSVHAGSTARGAMVRAVVQCVRSRF